MPVARIVTRDSLAAAPWKNGGGVTRQIASFPSGSGIEDFAWRVSTATVSQDGAFSRFEGIDRRLYLLAGAGLDLEFHETGVQRLLQGQHLDFPGEAPVTGRLMDGPVTDLNIMLRRDRQRASFQDVAVAGTAHLSLPWQTALLFVMEGEVSLPAASLPATAKQFDAVVLDSGHPPQLDLAGFARLLLVGFDTLE